MPEIPSPKTLLSGTGMIAVGVISVLFWQSDNVSLWWVFALGSSGWIVSLVLKLAWAVPLNKVIVTGLNRLAGESAGKLVSWIYIGLLTGIFECGVTYLFVVKSRLKTSDWNQAVAFGIGFGATEAVVLGLVSFIGSLVTILSFDHSNADEKKKIIKAANRGTALILLPIVERITALVIHAFSCVLIVYGVHTRHAIWFWLSFAFKSAIDSFAMWGIVDFQVKESTTRLAQFNLLIAGLAAVALLGMWLLHQKFLSLAT